MKPIYLSKSTINNLYLSAHSWNNRLLGIKIPETPAMTGGKQAHELIEAHCTGEKPDERFKDLWKFSQKEYKCFTPFNDKYSLYGYVDLIDFKTRVFGEIKTSVKTIWSQQRFNEAMEVSFYALAVNFRKAYFITCTQDLTQIKTYYKEITDKDIEKAKLWVEGAIKIIEGDTKADLIDGKCEIRCPYGENCWFKN